MTYETTKIAEYNEAEGVIIFAMGHDEYGLLYDSNPKKLEIYIDHKFSGAGCDNMILEGFGKTLDLEFCRSETL